MAVRCFSPPDIWWGRWLEPMAETDLPERRLGALAPLGEGDPGVEEAVGDVVESGNARRQVEVLEDEADTPGAERREVAVLSRAKSRPSISTSPVLARSSVPMMLSMVDLPEPDGPTMATSFAASDLKADIAQSEDAAREAARDVAERDDRRNHRGTPALHALGDTLALNFHAAAGEQAGSNRTPPC